VYRVSGLHRGLEQRRAKRQHLRAVRRGAFGKGGDRLTACQPCRDALIHAQQVPARAALDEQRVVAREHAAEHRPATRLGLGDDREGQDRVQRHGVQP